MDHVSSLIPNVLKKHGLYDEAHSSMMVFRAKKWLEKHHPDLVSTLHPQTFNDGVLTVKVDDSLPPQAGALWCTALQAFLQSDGKYMVKEVRCITS